MAVKRNRSVFKTRYESFFFLKATSKHPHQWKHNEVNVLPHVTDAAIRSDIWMLGGVLWGTFIFHSVPYACTPSLEAVASLCIFWFSSGTRIFLLPPDWMHEADLLMIWYYMYQHDQCLLKSNYDSRNNQEGITDLSLKLAIVWTDIEDVH